MLPHAYILVEKESSLSDVALDRSVLGGDGARQPRGERSIRAMRGPPPRHRKPLIRIASRSSVPRAMASVFPSGEMSKSPTISSSKSVSFLGRFPSSGSSQTLARSLGIVLSSRALRPRPQVDGKDRRGRVHASRAPRGVDAALVGGPPFASLEVAPRAAVLTREKPF